MFRSYRLLLWIYHWFFPLCLVLVGLTHAAAFAGPGPEQSTNLADYHFKYERYDTAGGALFKSRGRNADYNDSIRVVFVDSQGRVWVGTVTGLAVYDGKQWSGRTFKARDATGRVILGALGISDCGPSKMAEGPPGTIWFGGNFGIWRYRDGRYEEVSSEITTEIGMVVDRSGALWVLTRYNAQRYDGKTWTTVLRPYFDGSIHRELPGLFGMAN